MKEVNISGSTELTAAVVNAVEQLKEFNCRRLRGMPINYYIVKMNFRRILCLTDGYNSSSVTYETALQCSKVCL